MSLLSPDQQIQQRYRILSLLRQRSSQETYLAWDQETQTEVILKAMPLSGLRDWQSLDPFEREAKALRHLKHARIPKLIDSFHSDPESASVGYLVTEKIPGQSLAERLASGWKTTEARAIEIATDLLQILIYLHGFSPPVIHRDIKPSHLILDAEDRAYLIDFGSVKNLLKAELTGVGTFGYMAPEQFAGQVVPASDLYALGVSLIEMLSLCAPEEIPRQDLHLDYHALVNLSPGFRHWLDRLVEPTLSARWASAEQALAALQKLADSVQSQSTLKQPALRPKGPVKTSFSAEPSTQPDHSEIQAEELQAVLADAPALTRIALASNAQALTIQIPALGGVGQALGASIKSLLLFMGCFGVLAFLISLVTTNLLWFGVCASLLLVAWLFTSSDESKAIRQSTELKLTPKHLIYHVTRKAKPIRSVSFQIRNIRGLNFNKETGIQLLLVDDSPLVFCKLNTEEAAWLRSEMLLFLKPHLEPAHWRALALKEPLVLEQLEDALLDEAEHQQALSERHEDQR